MQNFYIIHPLDKEPKLYFPYQGEIFAILTSLCWSYAVILFRKSGFHTSPISLNLFKNTIAVGLLLLTMFIFKTPLLGVTTWSDFFILILSGLLGIAIADTLFFNSLNILGASINAIVACFYAPLTVLFAYILIGERILFWDFIGAIFIVGAVFMTSATPKSSGIEKKELTKGIVLGITSMALMAFGIVLAKPIIDRTPVLWSSTVRLIGGNFALVIYTLFLPSRSKIWSVFIPQQSWRTSIPASIIGAYISMILWIAGMKFTQASIAAILNQLSTIFTVILAFLLLKEPLTTRKIVAVLMAVTGTMFVIWG